MKQLKQLFDFYLDSSIHVALSCFALVNCTYLILNISINYSVALFALFGTIAGYNFVKFDALARAKRNNMSWKLKAIAGLSFLSLIIGIYYFFELEKFTKIIAPLFLILTLLYTLPFFPNKKNARNWAGFKIYIVTICWIGVTVLLPIINSGYRINLEIGILIFQRFLLIFSLILIFEIKDFINDDPHLKTVPQQIGVKKTKTTPATRATNRSTSTKLWVISRRARSQSAAPILLATTDEAPIPSPMVMPCNVITSGNVNPRAASSKVPTRPM